MIYNNTIIMNIQRERLIAQVGNELLLLHSKLIL